MRLEHSKLSLRRAEWLVLAGTTLAAGAVGFFPLFGGPGYEAALALGLILPLPLACAAAARACPAAGARVDPRWRSGFAVLGAALRFAALVIVAQLVVVLLHGARAGYCDPAQGLALLALGPFAGTLLAAAWGTLAGLAAAHWADNRARRAVAWLWAASGPLGAIAVSVWRFWSSPMIFAFDPFVGFFSGTLYDTVIDALPRLVTYRAGSFGSLVAAAACCALLRRDAAGRLRRPALRGRLACMLAGLAGLALSIGVTARGPALGHYQTTSSIRVELRESFLSERCEVVYPSAISLERARLLGAECDAHVTAHERYFETQEAQRITVFAFASAAQKGALMGASNTYIAKPWRHEVYVQSDNYPHPVLSHELAHVVAGSFGTGPLRVAGPLGGWLPDPGRIEGFAVAAAPAEDTEYTLAEWSRALLDLELLPPLSRIFRLTFLGQNSATAYTVAGAVVQWLHATYGPAPLRAWYAGASVGDAFGKDLDALDREFRASLEGIVLSDRALELARTRFDRPAIFGRRCPHVVDRLLAEASGAMERADTRTAAASYAQTLELDAGNVTARLGLAACAQRQGQRPEAEARLESMAEDTALTRVQRGAALERLADIAYAARDVPRALALYERTKAHGLDEHRLRTIEVKAYALQHPAAYEAVRALLIGDGRSGPDLFEASVVLGAWSVSDPNLGLADYLIGKNFHAQQRWRLASEHMQRALGRPLPLDSVRREALRTSVFAACATGDEERARAALASYVSEPGLSAARKEGIQRFADQCAALRAD